MPIEKGLIGNNHSFHYYSQQNRPIDESFEDMLSMIRPKNDGIVLYVTRI
jgi:hypothetical protein